MICHGEEGRKGEGERPDEAGHKKWSTKIPTSALLLLDFYLWSLDSSSNFLGANKQPAVKYRTVSVSSGRLMI